MGLIAKPLVSRASEKHRWGKKKWSRAAQQFRAHCTIGAERTIADTSAIEAVRQKSLPTYKQDKTPWPRRLAGPEPPPALVLYYPLSIIRTLSLPRREREAVPLKNKQTALIVSLNFEQKEYLPKRSHFSQKRFNYHCQVLVFIPLAQKRSQCKIKSVTERFQSSFYSPHELYHMLLLLLLTF